MRPYLERLGVTIRWHDSPEMRAELCERAYQFAGFNKTKTKAFLMIMTGKLNSLIRIGAVVALAGSLAACNLSRTERTVATGGGIGAATGTGIAILAGGPVAAGALIGGAAGATSGALFEKSKKNRYR